MTEKPDAHLRVRLPEDMLDALKRCGAREDRTVSWLVRQAVESYLAEAQKREKDDDRRVPRY